MSSIKNLQSKVEIIKADLQQVAKDVAMALGVPEESTNISISVHPTDRFEPTPNLLLSVLAAGGYMANNNGSSWVKVITGRGALTVFFTDEQEAQEDEISE